MPANNVNVTGSWTINDYTITATANPTVGGTITGAGNFDYGQSCTLIASANEGYTFVNWTKDGVEVSTNTTYSFTVTENATYVANFNITQAISLYKGWTWWSSYIEMDDFTQLEEGIGANGKSISSQSNGFVSYDSGMGAWVGDLQEVGFDMGQMYKIETSAACEFNLDGPVANPADHPITLTGQYTWIGYPVAQVMSVNDAFNNLTPALYDIVKSSDGFAMYSGSEARWFGTLEEMEPGRGYVYISNASEEKEFYYASNGKRSARGNVRTDDNYWQPQSWKYKNNMNVIATVSLNGTELNTEEVEVGAFVNGECRGSSKLMYFEPTGTYVAFLTVYGADAETVSFRIMDESRQYEAEEGVTMQIDGVVGNLKAPFVLHAVDRNTINLFPNPVTNGNSFSVEVLAKCNLNAARVEIYNALGNMVRSEQLTESVKELSGLYVSGVYTVKVIDNNGNAYFSKLVVK